MQAMRKVPILVAAVALAGIGFSVFHYSPSVANPFGGGGSSVTVSGTVDTNIISAARLEASVSTAPGTYLAVAGDASGTVLRTSLDQATIDSITAATSLGNCTYTDGDPTATISTTAANIPASPLANRTAITIWNHSAAVANALICSASGTATATHGMRIEHSGQWWKWEGLGAGVLISCRCTTGTCTYGYLEERCYQ